MSIISFSGLFQAIGVFILLLVFYAIYLVVISPLWKLQFYKKQGLATYYFPMVGLNKKEKDYEPQTNDIMGYFRHLAQTEPNIKAMAGNIGAWPDLVLFDPTLVKEFLQNQHLYVKTHMANVVKALMGTGLFFAEGDHWKKNRRIIGKIFHFDFLKAATPLTVELTREFFGQITKGPMDKVNIMRETQRITGEMVGRIFFSEHLNEYTLNGLPLTLALFGLLSRLGPLFRKPILVFCLVTGMHINWIPAFKEFLTEIQKFRNVILQIIRDRKASPKKRDDLLALLLETQKAPNPEDQLSDDDIVNEFITFFVAGMDTSAHVITMALYLLHEHPECLKKVQKEVEEHYVIEQNPNYETVNKMEYLQAVVKEAMRVHNPVPVPVHRIAQVDHTLGNLQIKKGTFVRLVPVFNGSNHKYFEDPEKFKPERWITKKDTDVDPFAFIPFSAGPRNCIGQHLGMIETKIIISEFLKTFKYKIVPEDYKLHMVMGSLYEPREELLLQLEKRN